MKLLWEAADLRRLMGSALHREVPFRACGGAAKSADAPLRQERENISLPAARQSLQLAIAGYVSRSDPEALPPAGGRQCWPWARARPDFYKSEFPVCRSN